VTFSQHKQVSVILVTLLGMLAKQGLINTINSCKNINKSAKEQFDVLFVRAPIIDIHLFVRKYGNRFLKFL